MPSKTKPERGEARTKSKRTPDPTAERKTAIANRAVYRHLRASTVAILVGDDGAAAKSAWGHMGVRSARVSTPADY